jgi:hypothetical protein
LLSEALPDPGERPVSFNGVSFLTGEILLDLPAPARLELGGQLGVRIGNLQYTGFNLGDKSGDNVLSLDLTPSQRSAWNQVLAVSGDPLYTLFGASAVEAAAATLDGLQNSTAGLPPDQALALIDQGLRLAAEGLLAGQATGAAGIPEPRAALLQPFADTVKTVLDDFFYEKPGEVGLRNLDLRGEFTGSTASQYRYLTAGGDQIFAEVTRGYRASSENSLGLQVLFGTGQSIGSDSASRTRMEGRSSGASASLSAFTVGRNRWALAVTEIRQEQEASVDVRRLETGPGTGDGTLTRQDYSRSHAASQVENRLWALRRTRPRGWDLELGVGIGDLHSSLEDRSSRRSTETTLSASGAEAQSPGSDALSGSVPAAPFSGALSGEAFDTDRLDTGTRSRLGAGFLLGARRDGVLGEAGARAIYFGGLQQQLTAALDRRLPLGRLGLVGDLQADLIRQPGIVWDDGETDYRLESVSSYSLTPTGALVWSLGGEAPASLHTWQSPFEFTARRRDPRRLGRALFAGASGTRGEEMFAGMAFRPGSYVAASMRQGEGSYRHFTLSGRAQSLWMELGLGSGTRDGVAPEDGRHEVSLSYLQFVYNRNGERYLSLTLNPESRGLDVALAADSRSLAASMSRAWTRFRRLLGL